MLRVFAVVALVVLLVGCAGKPEVSSKATQAPVVTRTLTTTTVTVTERYDVERIHVSFDGTIDGEEKVFPVEDGKDSDSIDIYQFYAYRNDSIMYIGILFYDLAYTSNSIAVINLRSDRMYQILVYSDRFEFKNYGYGGRVYYSGVAKLSCNSVELLLNLSKLEDKGINTDFRIVQVGVVVRGYGGFTQLDRMSPGIKPYVVRALEVEESPGIFDGLTDVSSASSWREERLDGLLLRYHNGDKSRKAILSAIEVARARVCAVFECPEVRVTVYADHEEFERAVGVELPEWSVGSGDVSGIKLQSPSSWSLERSGHSPMHVCQIVVHEYTHFVTSNIAAELPKWLSEGLAVYLAIQNDEGRVADAYRTGKLIPIEELEERWLEDPGLAYSEAGSFVKFLVEGYGWEAIGEILRKLGSGEGIGKAVEDVTGKTLRQLEDEWIRSASDKK